MYRDSIITLVTIILIHEGRSFASPMNISVCFTKNSWCPSELTLCDNASSAYIMSVSINQSSNSEQGYKCYETCTPQITGSLEMASLEVLRTKCNGQRNCSLANVAVYDGNRGGTLTLTFLCNNTDNGNEENKSTTNYTGTTPEITMSITKSSVTFAAIPTTKNSTIPADDSISSTVNSTLQAGTVQPLTGSGDPYTAVIVVSVVVPIFIVVVVVSVFMYRRGQCKLLLGKCTKRYAKHSPDTTDTHAISSTANVNLYCDLNRDVNVNSCEVHYFELDEIGKETGIE